MNEQQHADPLIKEIMLDAERADLWKRHLEQSKEKQRKAIMAIYRSLGSGAFECISKVRRAYDKLYGATQCLRRL